MAYVRVSSADQNPDRQLAAVGQVERVFQDAKSGRNVAERPELSALLRHVSTGRHGPGCVNGSARSVGGGPGAVGHGVDR